MGEYRLLRRCLMERPSFPESNNNGVPQEKGGSTFFAKTGQETQVPREIPIETDAASVATKERAKETRRKGGIVPRLVAGALAIGALGSVGLGIKYVSSSEKNSQPPSSQDIDSVPGGTSFNNDGSVPEIERLSPLEQPKSINQTNPPDVSDNNTNNNPRSVSKGETQKVNPEEVFDNTATKGVITERNSVVMTPKQYQDTSPQLINGDSVVIPLSIELPPGQKPNLNFKKEKGKMFGGKRFINGRMEDGKFVSDGTITVNDVLIISGFPIGGIFFSLWDGEIEFSTSSGYKNPDGSLRTATFNIHTTDADGNKVILFISTGTVKPLIEPSPIEYQEGTNTTKPLTRRPIKVGDPIVENLTTQLHPNFEGQFRITAASQVEENGQRGGGPAEIIIATIEDKAVISERGSESK